MASIRKRGSKWQVQVRRNGLPALNRTFLSKDDAIRWAREQDRAADRGEISSSNIGDTSQTLLSEIMDRYVKEVSPCKRGSMDRYQIRSLVKALGQLSLFNLKPTHLAFYRDKRLKEVSPTTVAKEMGALCHVLKVAAVEWGYAIRVEQFRVIGKPSPRRGRTRRLEADESERLLEILSASRNPLIRSVFQFALATGMRRGEVLSLKWSNIDLQNRVALLSMTKNGEARRVPLSPSAIQKTLSGCLNNVCKEGMSGDDIGLVDSKCPQGVSLGRFVVYRLYKANICSLNHTANLIQRGHYDQILLSGLEGGQEL